MAYDFNVNEIFEMAIRIEKNGARFYRKAAENQSDESNRNMLEKLAIMEDHHKLTFEKMRQTLSDTEKAETVFDPDEESSQYLAAMADTHGGEGSPDAADALTGEESIDEIISQNEALQSYRNTFGILRSEEKKLAIKITHKASRLV